MKLCFKIVSNIILSKNDLNPVLFQNVSIITDAKNNNLTSNSGCHFLIDHLLLLESLKTWRGCKMIDQATVYISLPKDNRHTSAYYKSSSTLSMPLSHLRSSDDFLISRTLKISFVVMLSCQIVILFSHFYVGAVIGEDNEDDFGFSVDGINFEPEMFNEMLSRMGRYRPDGADVGQICSICLESLGNGDLFQPGTCSHVYHRDCFLEWFQSGGISCPICRRSFNMEH